MNKKERVLAAIQFKPVDRIPTTFRANNYLADRLMEHFNIEAPINLGQDYKKLLNRLGADFWSSGTKIDKFSTLLPEYNGKPPQEPYIDDGTFFYTIGIKAKKAKMRIYDIEYPNVGVDPPLADINSPEELKNGFLSSKLDLFDFSKMKNKYRDFDLKDPGEEDVICIGSLSSLFMICCYLRGMENFLMDMVFNQGLAERITKEVGEFCIEFNKRELQSVGSEAVYYGTWDDVAGTNGMMFDPKLFKKYFLPIYQELISNNKKHGLFFGWHICGSVHEVLPMMIDAGIDVFDVVQTSAKDMEIENIYKLYGKSVCLHGSLDIQKLLVEKTAKQVKEEIKKIKHLWGQRGGIILAPSHETLPDTPIENMIAIYEEVQNP